MHYIPLTQGRSAIVDFADYGWLLHWKWSMSGRYAVRNFRLPDGRQSSISMHRALLNPPADMEVDHINGNPIDNRRENLRLATPSQNQWNKGPRKDSKRGYKGTRFCKKTRRWHACIAANRITVHLGYFDSEDDAAHAYDIAATALHGSFARLNNVGSFSCRQAQYIAYLEAQMAEAVALRARLKLFLE